MKRVWGLEPMVSAAVNAKTYTRMRNTEHAVRLATEDTWYSQITDARARVIASTDCLCTGVKDIVVWIGDVMGDLLLDYTTSIRDGHRASCEKLINLTVAVFTAAPVDASAAPSAGSTPAGDANPLPSTTFMDLDVVSSGSVHLRAETGDANAIRKAVAELIGNVIPSRPSACHARNALTLPER